MSSHSRARSAAAIFLSVLLGMLFAVIGPAAVPASASAGSDTLLGRYNETLSTSPGNSSLFSSPSVSPRYEARMQNDGNFVLYGPNGPLWATYTHGSANSRMVLQSDGNLVLYDGGTAIFATGTSGSDTRLVMQTDGNLVLYAANGSALWATYTNGGASKMAAAGAVSYAKNQLGKPYRYGGSGPDDFDCSGLTSRAYASVGISLPRTSQDQWHRGTAITNRADLQPGDLVFYYSSTSPSHVAIFIGAGKIIEALKTGTNVMINPLDYPGGYVGGRRVA
jgi:hypothetical protein